MNQSVYAMFDRYAGHGITPLQAAPVAYLPASGSVVAMALTAAVLLAVTCAALWLFRGRQAPDSAASLLEYGTVFIVSALFGPLAWKAYLVVLLCPCMVLIALLRRPVRGGDRTVMVAALIAYFVLAVLPAPGLLGRRLAGALEMLSAPTLGTLVLLGVLLWARARCAGATGRAG